MAAFQPIEDAGPRVAFGIVHFLRVFVTAASPGVLEENSSGTKTFLGLLQIVQVKSGQDGTMVLKVRFGRKKGFQDFFLIGWI